MIPPSEVSTAKNSAKKTTRKVKVDPSIVSSPIFEEIEERIGYCFKDPSLLRQSLTHRSFSQEVTPPEEDNQRLEFLGDAVLQLIITERLLYDFRDDDEGKLTRKRSEKVSGRALAKAARQLGLDRFIRLGRGEEKTGGREKASILADALEALVGAVYLDSNFQTCSELVIRWTSQSEMDVNNTDFKSRLQEILQRKEGVQPVYRVIREYGPEHEKVFEVEVYCQGDILGRGAGITKKAAEQAAARESLLGI